ncbi:MAG: glycosyl hydrolase family 18 protein, partial [Bacteroidota bacterium]
MFSPRILPVFSALLLLSLDCATTVEPVRIDDPVVEMAPEPCRPYEKKASDRVVAGFYPAWEHETLPIDEIPFERFTRIVYAFAYPEADGSLDVRDMDQVSRLVDRAHAAGVEVYVSLATKHDADHFPGVSSDPVLRRRFVQQILGFLVSNCMDGVDVDWERWDLKSGQATIRKQQRALLALLRDLDRDIRPRGYGVSIDVYPSHGYGRYYPDAIPDLVDLVQIMAYDFSGTWSRPKPHSTYAHAVGDGTGRGTTGLAYWSGYRNWPAEKLVLGLPLYGRNFNDGGTSLAYRLILADTPAVALA